MGDYNVGVRVSIKGESEFNAKMRELNNTLGLYDQKLKEVDATMASSGSKYSTLASKQDILKQKTGTLTQMKSTLQQALVNERQKLQSLTTAYNESVQKNGEASRETQALKLKMEQSAATCTKLEKGISKVNTELAGMSNQGKQGFFGNMSDKLNEVGDAFLDIADKTKYVSGVAAAGLTVAAKSAGELEYGATQVGIALNNLDPKSIQAISKEMQDLRMRTGMSREEATTLYNDLARAGIPKEELTTLANKMADFHAAVGEVDVSTLVQDFATLRNITGLSTQDFDKYTNSVLGVADAYPVSAAGVSEIAESLATLGGAFNHFGAKDILQWSGALASVGEEGKKGGTQMQRLATQIDLAVGEGGAKMEKFAKVAGMSAQEFSNSWQTRPSDAMKKVVEGLGNVKDSGGNVSQTLQDLGINSVREIETLLKLSGAGGKLDEAFKLVDGTWTQNNNTSEKANALYETGKGYIDRFKAALEVLAETVGEKLLPKLEPVVEKFEEFVEALRNNPDLADFVANLGLIAALISPLSLVAGWVSKIAGFFFKAAEGVGKFLGGLLGGGGGAGAAGGGLGLGAIIGIVIAIIGILVLLYQHCEPFREFVNDIADKIKKFYEENIQPLVDQIKNFIDNEVKPLFEEVCNSIGGFFERVGQFFKDVYEQYLKPFAQFFSDIAGIIGQACGEAAGALGGALWEAIKAVWEVVKVLLDAFKELWDAGLGRLVQLIVGVAIGALIILVGAFAGVISIIAGVIGAIANIIKWVAGCIKIFFEFIGEIGKLIGKLFEGKISFEDFWKEVKKIIDKYIQKALDWGKDFVKNLINGIKSMIGHVKDVIGSIGKAFKGLLGHSTPDEGPMKDDDKWTVHFMENLIDGMKDKMPALKSAVSNVGEVFTNGLEGQNPFDQILGVDSQGVSLMRNYQGVMQLDVNPEITVKVGNEQFKSYIIESSYSGISNKLQNSNYLRRR